MNTVLKLVDYTEKTGFIEEEEQIWAVNVLFDALGLGTLIELPVAENATLPEILDTLLDDAYTRDVLKENTTIYRDLFDTELMGRLTPHPTKVRRKFEALYRESPKTATDRYYKLSGNMNYIRHDHCAKDLRWVAGTAYGTLDISVNLSRPERDPEDIVAARNPPVLNYPRCLFCAENEDYAGRVNHPARQSLQVVPIAINEKPRFLQYSPYVYCNEHYICLNREHTPMKIDRDTFTKLLNFIHQFPHYFVGSNADLLTVGGSVLAHGHFQGGHYSFAMEQAEIKTASRFPGFDDVSADVVE